MYEQIDVTVPGPPVTARVSVEQIAAYLRRTGWRERSTQPPKNWVAWERGPREEWIFVPRQDCEAIARRAEDAVMAIARVERRPVHEVLQEIAREPLPKPERVKAGQLWAVDGGEIMPVRSAHATDVRYPPTVVVGFANGLSTFDSDMLTSDRWTYHGRRERETT